MKEMQNFCTVIMRKYQNSEISTVFYSVNLINFTYEYFLLLFCFYFIPGCSPEMIHSLPTGSLKLLIFVLCCQLFITDSQRTNRNNRRRQAVAINIGEYPDGKSMALF